MNRALHAHLTPHGSLMRKPLLLLCFGIAATLGTAGCDAANQSPEVKAMTVAINAKKAVRERLKDPESARFGKIQIHSFTFEGKEFLGACGTVNAKNSFGGYVGMRRFISVGNVTGTWLQGTDEDATFDDSDTKICSGPVTYTVDAD